MSIKLVFQALCPMLRFGVCVLYCHGGYGNLPTKSLAIEAEKQNKLLKEYFNHNQNTCTASSL